MRWSRDTLLKKFCLYGTFEFKGQFTQTPFNMVLATNIIRQTQNVTFSDMVTSIQGKSKAFKSE